MPAELIKAGGRKIRSDNHKLIISIANKEELSEEGKEYVIVSIYNKIIKQTVVIINESHLVPYIRNFTQHPALKANSVRSGIYLALSRSIST